MSTAATTPAKVKSTDIPLSTFANETSEQLAAAQREDFITLAYRDRRRITDSLFPSQCASLKEDVYWSAVAEIVRMEWYIGLTHPMTYLKNLFEWRMKDAIKHEIGERPAFVTSKDVPLTWKRDLEGNYENPTPKDAERFEHHPDYLDFVKWLRTLDRVEAEVFLQRAVKDTPYAELGQRFGRDEFWARRVSVRLTKKLATDLGLFPKDVEDLAAEALNRRGPQYPLQVVRVKLDRDAGRRIIDREVHGVSRRSASEELRELREEAAEKVIDV
jgi:DNA-directed RNA polymerase specialized sigma24 family protein